MLFFLSSRRLRLKAFTIFSLRIAQETFGTQELYIIGFYSYFVSIVNSIHSLEIHHHNKCDTIFSSLFLDVLIPIDLHLQL